jgi:hypothetical protein
MIERWVCIILMIGFVIGFSTIIFYPELLPIAFDTFNNLFYNR